MGTTLARGLARVGHDVSLPSSRSPGRIAADVVILAIPTKAIPTLPNRLFADSASSVVVDISNYHPELRDGCIDAIEQGLLESEWVAQQIEHPVIKAFNSIFAESLRDKGVAAGTPGRVALPVSGDSAEGRAIVSRLIDQLGFDAVEAGALRESWRQGTGAPCYCQDLDVVGLRRALAYAERSRISEYRSAEEARIRRAMA